MDPITIGVVGGAAILGGLAQYYNSEKERKASKAQLSKIEATFNAIKPPDYDLSIREAPELHMEQLSLPKFSSPMSAPKFNLAALKPEQFKLIGKFNPELANYVAEANPTLIKQTKDMDLGRKAQIDALNRYREIGAGEFDPQYAEMTQRAARNAQAEAQSRQASIMQDFARRGISGSGLNLASQMGASAQSMDRTAAANQAAASQAYQNRLNALASGATLGGQISQEDQRSQMANADIINSFNQRVSRERQGYANRNADIMNQAQQTNLAAGQGIANQNVTQSNSAMMGDRARSDELTKYGYDFARQEQERADRLAQLQFSNRDMQNKYQNSLLASQASWDAGEREKLNDIKSQMFNNQMAIAQGKSGIASQQIAQGMSAARDKNAIIQGITNAGMTGALAYGANQQGQKSDFNTANSEFYRRQGRWMSPKETEDYKTSQENF